MNVQEYISSGIVESYVLGLATPEEQREFEKNCAEFPEVLAARNAFEIALEEQAMQNAIAPPADLKRQLLAAVTEAHSAPVVPITTPIKSGWLRYAAAAAVLLLVGSVIWNISLVNKNRQIENELTDVRQRYDTTGAQLADIKAQLEKLTGGKAGDIKMAAMKGLEAAPSAYATVYWDSTSKDVYLMVNNLPTPASDQQYQLWALLDGKPIDLGLIPQDYFIGEKKLLLTMKNTVGAQAFAITLEKKGGSSTAGPQGVMYTLGKL